MVLAARRRGTVAVALVAWMAVVALAGADLAADSKLCVEKLAVLATCLPVVEATATATVRAPTPECCAGIREVLGDSKKCLCVLINDRDDPAIGIKVNVTCAMDLPSACSVAAVLSASVLS